MIPGRSNLSPVGHHEIGHVIFQEAQEEISSDGSGIDVGQPAAIFTQVASDLVPLQPVKEIDQVRGREEHLVAPVTCQEGPGPTVAGGLHEGVSGIPLHIQQRGFHVPDFLPRTIHKPRVTLHAFDRDAALTFDVQEKP